MTLNDVVPWGRSLNEYKAIFSLTDEDLGKTILGCGDGPASFNAELSALGGQVTSVDPTYQFSASELRTRIGDVYEEIMQQLTLNQDKYHWDKVGSVSDLGKLRMSAMNRFIDDLEIGKTQGRYHHQALPHLDFSDHQFDLALCSHYLFLYSDHVSFDEHLASVIELCRVAKEVRIYPLITLKNKPSPHIEGVETVLTEMGLKCARVKVAYEFQKGATEMLVVRAV